MGSEVIKRLRTLVDVIVPGLTGAGIKTRETLMDE